jgi:hypothetical protein
MDAGGFDTLSRSLDARSRRGVLRALGLLGAVGFVDRLGVTTAEARKEEAGLPDVPGADRLSAAR